MTVDLVTGTGLIRTADHRYFWQGEGPFPGITTVVGVLDKSGPLMNWAAKQVAIHAVETAYETAWALHDGATTADDLVRELARLPEKRRDQAAVLGSAVHFYAEQIGLGHYPEVPPEAWPMVRQYLAWREQWPHDVVAVEYMGVNLAHRYAGTGDLIVRHEGQTWLLDIKTGKYYDTTALQLVACAELEFIGKPNDPGQTPVPAIDRFGVLDLKPDGWKVVPYVFDRAAAFEAFTRLAAIYHWKQGFKRVMRAPIEGRATEGMFDDHAA